MSIPLKYLRWLPLVIAIVWSATPLLWAVLSSFKTPDEYYTIPPTFLPVEPTMDAYVRVFTQTGYTTYALNSFILAAGSTILTLIFSLIAAYGFARYAFAWRHILLLFILIPRLVPRISLIVPLYDMVSSVGLIDSYTAMIIVYTASAVPLATWILIGFVAAVPKEIEEAARVDGASTFTIITKFIVPLTIPGILTVTVLAVRDSWNEFPFILALTSSPEIRTLPYQLFLFGDTFGLADQGLIQAFALLSILPILLLYIWLEKYVVQGLTQGAVK